MLIEIDSENKDLRSKLASLGYQVPQTSFAYGGQENLTARATDNSNGHATLGSRNIGPGIEPPETLNNPPGAHDEQHREVPNGLPEAKMPTHESIQNPSTTSNGHQHTPLLLSKRKATSVIPGDVPLRSKRPRLDSSQVMPPPIPETPRDRHRRIRDGSPIRQPHIDHVSLKNNTRSDLQILEGGKWCSVDNPQNSRDQHLPTDKARHEISSESTIDETLSALKNWPFKERSQGPERGSPRSVQTPFHSPVKYQSLATTTTSRADAQTQERIFSRHFSPQKPIRDSRGSLRSIDRHDRLQSNTYTPESRMPLIKSSQTYVPVDRFRYRAHNVPDADYSIPQTRHRRNIYVGSSPQYHSRSCVRPLAGDKRDLAASPFFLTENAPAGLSQDRQRRTPYSSRPLGTSYGFENRSPARNSGLERLPSINGLSFINEPHNNRHEPLVRPEHHDRPPWADSIVGGSIRGEDGLLQRPHLPTSSTYDQNLHESHSQPSSLPFRRPVGILPSSTPSMTSTLRPVRTPAGLDDLSAIKGARKGFTGSGSRRLNLFGGPDGVFSSGGRRSVRR
jgi:hypothetical protein